MDPVLLISTELEIAGVNDMNEEQKKIAHEAEELEQNQDWTRAADCWSDLSERIDNPQIAFNAARTLYLAKRFQEAYQAVLNFPDSAINEQNGLLIIKIYLAVNHYISGRMVVNQLPEGIRIEAKTLIEKAETDYREKFQVTIHNQLRTFYHLGDCSLAEQQQRLASADQLPLQDFMVGCQFLLRDPFTNPFVRSELLNILQRLRWQRDIVMLTIDDNEHHIIPANCPSAYQATAIQQCRDIIEQQFTNSNPQLLTTLNQQLDLQAILLAPIANQIIHRPDKWVQVLESLMMGDSMPDESADEQHWQHKINRIIEKIN